MMADKFGVLAWRCNIHPNTPHPVLKLSFPFGFEKKKNYKKYPTQSLFEISPPSKIIFPLVDCVDEILVDKN